MNLSLLHHNFELIFQTHRKHEGRRERQKKLEQWDYTFSGMDVTRSGVCVSNTKTIKNAFGQKSTACIEIIRAVGRKSLPKKPNPFSPEWTRRAPRGRQLARARSPVACG